MAQDDELAELHRDEPPGKPVMRVSEYGTAEELLAAIRDEIAQLATNFIAANSDKKHKPKPPRPWPRPETARQRAKARWQVDDVLNIVAKATPHAADRVAQALGQRGEEPDKTTP